jgi:hypothetical protein
MVKLLMNALVIVLIGPLLIVPLGVGLLILRYIEDGLEWITSHQPLPWSKKPRAMRAYRERRGRMQVVHPFVPLPATFAVPTRDDRLVRPSGRGNREL